MRTLRDGPLAAAKFNVVRWAPVAMAGAALLMFGAARYRLWQWERGDEPSCVTCGGPLGHEREGQANRGVAFRGCYACGKAVNHRHYEWSAKFHAPASAMDRNRLPVAQNQRG